MINILLAVLFALGLVTSGGITVAASQEATPDSVLFPVRTFVEDARLAMADDDTEAELALQFAEKYMEQMTHAVANGGELQGPFVYRYAQMFEHAVEMWEAHPLPETASENARTPEKNRTFSGAENPTKIDDGDDVDDGDVIDDGDVTTEERLQTLVETTQDLTALGAIDPVMILQHDRDRVNDNANGQGLQQRSEYKLVTGGDGEEPMIQGYGAGTPCEVDADGDGVFDTTQYYCYSVYHPTDGGWYWYYGTDPYSAAGTQPTVTYPRFPAMDLGPGPGPGSSNGSNGDSSKK